MLRWNRTSRILKPAAHLRRNHHVAIVDQALFFSDQNHFEVRIGIAQHRGAWNEGLREMEEAKLMIVAARGRRGSTPSSRRGFMKTGGEIGARWQMGASCNVLKQLMALSTTSPTWTLSIYQKRCRHRTSVQRAMRAAQSTPPSRPEFRLIVSLLKAHRSYSTSSGWNSILI